MTHASYTQSNHTRVSKSFKSAIFKMQDGYDQTVIIDKGYLELNIHLVNS